MSEDNKKLDIFQIMEEIDVRDPTEEEIVISRYNVLIFLGALMTDIKAIDPISAEEGAIFKSALENLEAMQIQATMLPHKFFQDIAKKSISCARVEKIVNEEDNVEKEKKPVIH